MSAGALALLADRGWLACTDDASSDAVELAGPEAAYKLGFANALQLVGQVGGGDATAQAEIVAAIDEACELLMPEDER